jgi:hypothetical protein
MTEVRIPAEAGVFLFTTVSRTGLKHTETRIQLVPGVRRPGREADLPPLPGLWTALRVVYLSQLSVAQKRSASNGGLISEQRIDKFMK